MLMPRRARIRFTAVMVVLSAMLCCTWLCAQLYAQQRPAGQAPAGKARPGVSAAPLFLKVEWMNAPGQTGQAPMVQQNVTDPNVEVKWYGAAAKQLLTTGVPGSD